MISDKKLQEFINFVHTEGMEIATKKLGLSEDSARRYSRLARERGIESTTTWSKAPRILVMDIETLPMECFTWGIRKQFLNQENIIKEWSVLSWVGKWLMEPDLFGDIVTPEEAENRDDRRVCQSMWECLDEADIVIAHNGRRFDIRKLNARFIFNEMIPPSTYDVIDTYNDMKSVALFTSFKQGYLTQFLELEEKLDTNFQLWVDCVNGDQDALDRMFEYNKHDVMGLEELYLVLRPWMKRHPSVNLLYGDMVSERCNKCGSTDTEVMHKDYLTPAGLFETRRCNNCGSVGRLGKNKVKKSSKNLRYTAH